MQQSPQVIVFLGISLDGYIAGEGGDLSWLSECANESPAETGYDELMARADTLVLGRNTYDAVLRIKDWPFGNKPVHVLTHRPVIPLHGERALQGDMEEALLALRASGAKCIYLDGGHVVRQALEKNLVDELVLSWVPVVLGKGVRLFEEGVPSSRWRLTRSRAFESGLVQAAYQRAA